MTSSPPPLPLWVSPAPCPEYHACLGSRMSPGVPVPHPLLRQRRNPVGVCLGWAEGYHPRLVGPSFGLEPSWCQNHSVLREGGGGRRRSHSLCSPKPGRDRGSLPVPQPSRPTLGTRQDPPDTECRLDRGPEPAGSGALDSAGLTSWGRCTGFLLDIVRKRDRPVTQRANDRRQALGAQPGGCHPAPGAVSQIPRRPLSPWQSLPPKVATVLPCVQPRWLSLLLSPVRGATVLLLLLMVTQSAPPCAANGGTLLLVVAGRRRLLGHSDTVFILSSVDGRWGFF